MFYPRKKIKFQRVIVKAKNGSSSVKVGRYTAQSAPSCALDWHEQLLMIYPPILLTQSHLLEMYLWLQL